MAISIVPFELQHVDAVRAFNQRLADGGAGYRFPMHPVPKWLPPAPGRRLFQEYFVALDDQGIVRGAYILKHQDYLVNGQPRVIGDFQLPISEGIVNRKYALLATQLMFDCIKRNSLEYGLGIGGTGEPVAKLMKAGGWTFWHVPFLFRVFRPWTFLRKLAIVRRRPLGRLLADLAAFSGLGWLAIKAVHRFKDSRRWAKADITVEDVSRFGAWADEVWNDCKGHYRYIAVRDQATLDILYPPERTEFIRLRFCRAGKTVGWAVCLSTQMTDHKQFGSMRLGSIVDALSAPADAEAIVGLAADRLRRSGADLAVTNQSHRDWTQACQSAGFLQGPTNFIFARSKALTGLLGECGIADAEVFLNRGDGDGPIHL